MRFGIIKIGGRIYQGKKLNSSNRLREFRVVVEAQTASEKILQRLLIESFC